jgi:hypothetical protein
MCTSTTSDKNWKRLFLAVEALVVLACFYSMTLSIIHHYDEALHPQVMTAFRLLEPMLTPVFWCFLVADLILIIISPFFLHSLRSTAMRAWIIGAAGLLFAWLLLTLYR